MNTDTVIHPLVAAPFLTRHRIGVWRAIVLLLFVALLSGRTPWQTSWVGATMTAVGIVLVSCATVGRLWCALYVSGRKGTSLVQDGPYSMCRHPLYVCNFMGITGLGAMSGSLLVSVALVLAFAMLYPGVMRSEERFLRGQLPGYADYQRRTPAFVPRPALYRTEATWTVDVRAFVRNVADSIWFPLLTIAVTAIDRAHAAGVLPELFVLP
ncbi:MAG: isoprenylcysteine carboxylmethyltransferase family protein [Variovorax sp.]